MSELDRDLLRRALAVVPGGAQTDTKTPPFRVVGIQPSFFVRGRGAHAQDVAGAWWLDCQMGLAAYVLGYADAAVNAAVAEQLAQGTLFSLSSPLELEVAELLLGIFPEFEMVRFAKNGSDATSAAIRIARYFTGREHIIGCGYHGFQDWSMTLRNGIGGIPSAVRELTHGNETVDLEQALTVLRTDPEKYAAFIVDTGGYGLPDRALLQEIQARCRRHGVVFIMDEVVSGFRVGVRGSMGALAIVPDLICLGKAVANGFPLSVVMGSKDLLGLAPDTGMSSTFGGDCVSLAAAKATLHQLRDGSINARIDAQGKLLMEDVRSAIERHGLTSELRIVGYPALFDLTPTTTCTDRRGVLRYLMSGLAQHRVFWQESFVLCRDFGPEESQVAATAVDSVLSELRTRLDDGSFGSALEALAARERSYIDGAAERVPP